MSESDIEAQGRRILSADPQTLTASELAWRQTFDEAAQRMADEFDARGLAEIYKHASISAPSKS